MFIYKIESKYLKREMTVELFVPNDLAKHEDNLELLVLNDGQDASQLNLVATLHNVYAEGHMKPLVIAAVYADKHRMDDFGVAGKLDYKRRGKTAKQYQLFIVKELIEMVKEKIKIQRFTRCHIAGFSMGALSAFDTAWKFDNIFYSVGCFSGSFWWRSVDMNQGYHDHSHRIVHEMIKSTLLKPRLKFWFQTGTLDEKNDRNNNGEIDSIDDTKDLVELLLEKGYKMHLDIQYREVQDGKHDYDTWSAVFPEYLVWLNYI
jgi:enterochelin esterase family protein